MTPDSFANALHHLDPGTRALLDLSLRRGLDDAEIAELLGADSAYVSSSREAAIAQLADDLGMHGDPGAVREALLEMPEDSWRRAPEPASGNGQGAVISVIDQPSLSEDKKPARQLAISRPVLIALLLAGVIVAVVLAITGGGSSSSPKKTATPPTRQSAPAAPAAGRSAPLASLGAAAKGTASLDGRRLTLKVSGLPQPSGLYEVWLYNDEIDAVPVTTFRTASATVKAKLPHRASRYRYLDISLEPADGNPNHSGDSILRVPLSSLR